MIFGLILVIFFVILLAFFIGKNLSNICTIWFFKSFTDIPVSLLVLVAFASGIVLAVICLLIGKLKSSTKQNTNETQTTASKNGKINKKKSLLKKAEKVAKKSENNNDATIVADSTNLR